MHAGELLNAHANNPSAHAESTPANVHRQEVPANAVHGRLTWYNLISPMFSITETLVN